MLKYRKTQHFNMVVFKMFKNTKQIWCKNGRCLTSSKTTWSPEIAQAKHLDFYTICFHTPGHICSAFFLNFAFRGP